MSPQRRLEELCRRHGVAPASAGRLLPLVRRALAARGEVRRQLFETIEAALAADAEEVSQQRDVDERALIAVAWALSKWPWARHGE